MPVATDALYNGWLTMAVPLEVGEKVRLAREAIGALDRAMKTRRLYALNHPLTVESTEDLLNRMGTLLERTSYLRLTVAPDELRLDSQTVLKTVARPSEFPFRLHKDGIREIRFHRGLSRDELLDFIQIVELSEDDLAVLNEDIVSMLWSKDFKSIDYIAVDEFDLAERESILQLDAEQVKVAHEVASRVNQIVARMAMESEPSEDRERFPEGCDREIAEAPRGPLYAMEEPVVSEHQLDTLFFSPLNEVCARWRSEVEGETIGVIVGHTLDLLSRLRTGGGTITARELMPLLENLLEGSLAKGEFDDVGYFLSNLQEAGFLRKCADGGEVWNSLLERARAPELIKPLLAYLHRTAAGDEGLRRYFQAIGPSLVRPACHIYAQVSNPHGRLALRQYLTEFGAADGDAFRDLITHAAEDYLGEVFDIIRAVHPSGLCLELDPYLKHPLPHLRCQALAVAAHEPGPSRFQHFLEVLTDPDLSVRMYGLKLMGESHEAALRAPLQEWIERSDFIHREASEKERAMITLAQVGGAAVFPYLKTTALRPPGVLHKVRAFETRRAAVHGIRELGTVEAFEFLRLAAVGTDIQLAEMVHEVLRQ